MLARDDASTDPLSVFLIEPDPGVAKLVLAALRAEGYQVMGVARSVRSARRQMGRGRPDIILLDGKEVMPDEFYRRVR